MERIDKLLAHEGFGSRKEIRKVLHKCEVLLNGVRVTDPGTQFDVDKDTLTIDGEQISLTPTEYALLHQLLSNRGKVLSRQYLMDTVWAGVVVTDRTVNVNITRMRKKLGTYAQNIVSRTGFGYVFEEIEK